MSRLYVVTLRDSLALVEADSANQAKKRATARYVGDVTARLATNGDVADFAERGGHMIRSDS